jgi:hypothetical protein
MTGLPEGFRVLIGTDLLRVKAARGNYIKGLSPLVTDGRTAGINDYSRIVRPIGSIDTDRDHLAAVRDAAALVGDSTAWIITDAPLAPNVVALEVDLAALFDFASKADFSSGDDWIPKSMQSWPADAVAAAYPDSSTNWALLSPSDKWGYLDTENDEYGFTALAGTGAFMREYRERRPVAPFDVLIWLHQGAYGLIKEPPSKWNWFRRRVPEGPPTRRNLLERYMESFYGREDAEWLWALYVETFMDGYSQGTLQGWKKFEEDLIARVKSDPANETRLQEVWDGSRAD